MKTIGCVGSIVLALNGYALAADFPPLSPQKQIGDGAIVGVIEGDVTTYRGIPFATPPVRENRWRDPQPVKPWTGTLVADRYSPMCLQPLRQKDSVFYTGEEATSEDCLYLNVWTSSAAKPDEKRPVMVFIY